jgi:hypothetical protein
MRIQPLNSNPSIATSRTAVVNDQTGSTAFSLAETILDSSGKYPLEDQIRAYSQLIEITGQPNFRYDETPEKQLIFKAQAESIIAKRSESIHNVFSKRLIDYTSKTDFKQSEGAKFMLDTINSFPPEEQAILAAGQSPGLTVDQWKASIAAQGELNLILEKAEAKGTFDPRKPEAAKDPKVAMAFKILESLLKEKESPKTWLERATAFLKQRDPVEDRVDLSPAAQAYLQDGKF